ncbi:helix-turn-helix transcriptional regulator [Thiocystis violacea]|uniref:helix-turn-helix transcriptional regulator n=1 Tax=Thiocystis violacea TaxID=13725 RepID=UPI001903FA1F|nr:AlpA family transcriptional regulator [Thiocystis violacea]MBK1716843.1 AlpA family transcriptional regulator [Thiocystis violacea]
MAAKAAPAVPFRIVRLPEAVEMTGLSRGSLYRLMQKGAFPKSVKLSERAVGWRESDLNAWLNSRQNAA